MSEVLQRVHLPEENGESEAFALTGGDCFLLAPQISFSLSDEIHRAPVSFCDLRAKAVQNVVHHGGGGAPTTLIWGLLQFNQGSVRPLTALLPRLILIRAEQTQATGLQATLQNARIGNGTSGSWIGCGRKQASGGSVRPDAARIHIHIAGFGTGQERMVERHF